MESSLWYTVFGGTVDLVNVNVNYVNVYRMQPSNRKSVPMA